MKKLDTSDFFVENKIISTSEDGVFYDFPKDKMQTTWDQLSSYYNQKSKEECKSEATIEEFYNQLSYAKLENDIAKETFELENINVVKPYDSIEVKEQKVNIKRIILNDIADILKRRLSELKDNIKIKKWFMIK
jgi:hypothetical protein